MNFITPNVLRLTSAGETALARSVAGETLSLTRIGIGDGVKQSSGGDGSGEIIGGGIFFPTDPTTPIPITGMVHERVSVDIETSKREGNTLVVSGSIPFPSEVPIGTNQTPFPWVETGLFGKFGEEAEILIAYCKDEDGETLDLDSDAVEREIYISMVFDADANIDVTLSPRSEIDWSKVSGKPETFPPSAHSHPWNSVTGKPSTFKPSAHKHTLADISDAPNSFAPANHTHAWGTITGKPQTFPPAAHSHPGYMNIMTVVDEEWDVAPGPKGDEVNVFDYDLTTLDSYDAAAYAQADMLHIEVEISGVGGDPAGNSPYYAMVTCVISKEFSNNSGSVANADIPFTDGKTLASAAVLRGARTLFRTGEMWLSWKRPAAEADTPEFFFISNPLHVYLHQQFAGGDGVTVHVRVTGYKL